MSVIGDNPIQKSEDDVLGRTKVARSFAAQVVSMDASQGVVVGVLGPWGSGKTSFVNLAREQNLLTDDRKLGAWSVELNGTETT